MSGDGAETAEAATEETEDAAAENEDDWSDLVQRAEEVLAIADEIEDVLKTVDLDDAVESLDADGIDMEALEEGNHSEAVDPLDLVDLPEAFDAVDVREFWREARELDEALDELADEGDDEFDIVDDGVDVGDTFETEDTFDTDMSLGMDDTDIPAEGLQATVQAELAGATEEFREGLVATRKHLKAMRESNAERTDSVGQPSSRNPTAVSTMSQSGPTDAKMARYSTVPEETRYSSAPNRERIYGSRFPDAEDDDE